MIRTICIYFFLFVSVIVVSLIGLPINFICLLVLRKFRPYMNYRVAQAWSLLLIKMTGCKMTVTGRENIPKKEGLCFVSNHGSIFDIVLILAYSGRPVGFIAKKELQYIPFINLWIPVLGGLYIDRKNLRRSLQTINKGVSRIKSGGTMVIFPEGHRSRGQGLLPFHSGALKLATNALAPIIPIAITGTYDVFEKNYRVCPGPVTVTFCEPIYTADIPSADRKHLLSEQVYQVISGTLGAPGFEPGTSTV